MPAKSNMVIGSRFTRLVVLSESAESKRRGSRWWTCRCDCGNMATVSTANLNSGNTRSCGCLLRDVMRVALTTHGRRRTPEYDTWCRMRGRCRNPRNPKYPRYGGRGITICPEWDDFAVFYRDMGPRPSPRHSLDRIDNDGPYASWNCRWATPTEQARNQSSNRPITYAGRTMTISAWSAEIGITGTAIYNRLLRGWSIERAVTTPLIPRCH
jgi:hypothetical protein